MITVYVVDAMLAQVALDRDQPYWADRTDQHGATRLMGWSFRFAPGHGIEFTEDNTGCPLAYLGHDHYERAHQEPTP